MMSAVLVVQVHDWVSDAELSEARAALLRDLNLTAEDFYWDAPLFRVLDEVRSPDIKQTDGTIEAAIRLYPQDTWIDTRILHAYYGPGYERGYFPLFVQTAEWLEARFSNCQVWYGEDSSGIVKPFGAAARAELGQYYEEVGGTPYYERHRSSRINP